MTRNEALVEVKSLSKYEDWMLSLVNEIYDDFKSELAELRTICKNSIVMCEADGTCILTDTEIMKKINEMIKECE